MAAVESRHYSSALRRSQSQPKFSPKQPRFRTSSSTSRISDINHQTVHVLSDSAQPSPPPSPSALHADSPDLSASPKSPPSLQLPTGLDHLQLGPIHVEEPSFTLPRYDAVGYFNQAEEDLEPPPSPRGLGDSYTVSPNDNNTSTGTSRPDTPELFFEHAEDDTAVRAQPSRHVDYLSHDWKEEDIWESWKYIVSRKGDYSNSARLENASWRTWMKSKNNLKTVSPETLNWLKDCDVTWLYGPLQTGTNSLVPPQPVDSVELTKSNSFISKKPILKKRSMSEIMLQRSLSSSSLLKQAAAAVQAQQKEGGRSQSRPRLERAATDYVTFPFSSGRLSPKSSSLLLSAASSGVVSPSVERKHIHFNEQVEQCIAVDVKGDDDEGDVDTDRYGYDSDSDDAIMMKRTVSKKKRPIMRRKSSSSNNVESKTIAMLPATTLKYREDTPEPPEPATAMKHSYRSPILSPSSSQETLRPSKPSTKFYTEEGDDDEEDDDEDETLDRGWRSPTPKPPSYIDDSLEERQSGGLKRSTSSSSFSAAPEGMHRTDSGMFVPNEGNEEEGASTAKNGVLLGPFMRGYNTGRDILYVIWNVGWRN